jgi:hypothetical protein
MAEPLPIYEGFPEGVTDTFVAHVVKAPSQYDTTCRALAAEVIRLRVAVDTAGARGEARGLERAQELAEISESDGWGRTAPYIDWDAVDAAIRALKEEL